ncbi:MAG: PLP-dependent aminotransferase family protein [Rhodospirillales bacterium]
MTFDYSSLLRRGLPPAAAQWTDFPEYNFIGGHNDEGAVPVDDFIKCAREVLSREGQTLATYGLASGAQGYLPLREFIAKTLNQRAGMQEEAQNILLVSGSLQALDLVNDVFLEPGDTVIAEEASYQGTLQRYNRCGVQILGAPLDDRGIKMDALINILSDLRAKDVTPKFIYTIPTVQNPTGTVMPEERRLQLLRISEDFGVPVFEDDCYADLTFNGIRPNSIRSLDDSGRVIYCGSFSKTIAPALRVGFIAADWNILSRLISLKFDAGSGALEQMLLGEYCNTHFEDHIGDMAAILKEKCDVMVEAVAAEFGTIAELRPPEGGIFVWVTLPDEVDTMKLSEVAGAEGVAINPGADWTVTPHSGSHKMRLCFGHASAEEIRGGIAKLAQICHREFGVPLRSGNVGRS